MKKLLVFLLPIIALTSCQDRRIESSDTMQEQATIVALIHSPSEHKTELTQTAFHNNNNIIGTDWNGNTGVKIGENLQITSTTIPEKFGVAFQCQHGTFTIEGSDTKHRVLYEKFIREVGDTVNILYKEQYLVTYVEVNGKKEVESRVLNKLDFIDAQKIK